jgi:Rhs element Vgr protein
MTAPSPTPAGSARVSFAIEVDGEEIDSTYQVVSIDTWVSVNKVPRAQIVLFDGKPAEGDFPISNAATFAPGAKVDIAAGYDDDTTTIFSGIVVKHGIEIDVTSGSKLVLDLADPCVVMTIARKSAAFEKKKDSEIIEALLDDSGLEKDVAATQTQHEKVVQYYATDWDLLVTRAELNGMVVTVNGGKVTVKPPDTASDPVLGVAYGDTILDLQAELDAASQIASSAIQSYAWDYSTQALASAPPGTVSVTEAGNLTSANLADVLKVKSDPRQSGALLTKEDLTDWSSATLLRVKLGKLRGHVRFQGSSLAEVGKTIELSGVGERFNGAVFIGGVHHGIRDGRWITTVTFGLSPKPFTVEAPHIASPGAAGQLPPIQGLQTGVVKKVSGDEAGEVRVLVTLPLLQEETGVWARLGSFYGSSGVGAVFYPEVGDEVVLGFMNDDPRYPVILGSVYSKARKPPVEPDEENTKKTLVTREKLTISFDEKDKIIEITTPGGHSIKMDDKEGSITLKDMNDNTVVLGKSGITLDSAKTIALTAKGDITLDAKGNVDIKAAAKASAQGAEVAVKAQGKLGVESGGLGELKATGILTIQGAIVNIN